MNPGHEELWRRILGFEIDDGPCALPFARRLARENGWTEPQARRVIEEYRRFVFLAMTAGHPATPSDAVEQAWHLHLMYTESYWTRFCGEVLGRALHHGRTRGGRDEGEKHRGQYRRTLASYRTAFGQAPPEDVWPPAEIRFGEDRHERVNLTRYRVVPRTWVRLAWVMAAAAGSIVLAAFLGGPLLETLGNSFRMKGVDFLWVHGAGLGAAVVGGLLFRWLIRGGEGEEEPELDAYEAAHLSGGEEEAARAALAALYARGLVTADASRGKFAATKALPAGASSFERAVHRAAGAGEKLVDIAPAGLLLEGRLRALGLLVTEDREAVGRLVPALGVAAVWLMGLFRVQGDRPLCCLIVALVLTVGAFVGFALCGMRRTRLGDRVLEKLRLRNAGLRARGAETGAADVALLVALFGVGALTDGSFVTFKEALSPPPSSSSGGGCGGEDRKRRGAPLPEKQGVVTESEPPQKKGSRREMIFEIFWQLLAGALFVGAFVGQGPFWRFLRHIIEVGSRGPY